MESKVSKSNYGCFGAIAAIVFGASLLLYGAALDPSDPVTAVFWVVGLLLFVGGLVSVIPIWLGRSRRKDWLELQWSVVVACWQVSPDDVERFRAIDAARRTRLWSLKNRLKLPKVVPPEGIPVVVGETSLAVGDQLYEFGVSQFETLGEVSWREGNPGFIELSSELDLSKGSTVVAVRLPVPEAARSEAARAFAHLRSKIDPRNRAEIYGKFGTHFQAAMQATDTPHPMQRRGKRFLIGFAVVCPAVVGIIFGVVYSNERAMKASLDAATQPTEVVACQPKETERINDFFLRGANIGPDRDREAQSVRGSLGGPCNQFFDRLLVASDKMVIPYLSGFAMHDRTTGTIEVPGEFRCASDSCEIPMSY